MTINEVKNYLQQDHIDDHKLTELRQDKRKGVQQLIKQYDKRVAKQAEVLSAFKEKVTFDQQYKEEGVWLVGVDEAGRGPLAGPVVTAAVCFEDYPLALLHVDDSKALTKEARNELAEVIKKHAYRYAIHFQSVSTIDELNIYEATRQSMQQSIEKLNLYPQLTLTDAMPLEKKYVHHSIIKGDAKSLAIAAASILAKTARDAYMDELSKRYPAYGFEQHAGYGTKQHLEAIQRHGILSEHRTTFEPVKTWLQERGL